MKTGLELLQQFLLSKVHKDCNPQRGQRADVLAYPKGLPPTEVPQPLHVLFISHAC